MAIKDLSDVGRNFGNELPTAIHGAFEAAALDLVKVLGASANKHHGSNGLLVQSISVLPVKETADGQVISIEWEDYGNYQDKGVQGAGGVRATTTAYGNKGDSWINKAPGSPFKYTTKKPPMNSSALSGKSLLQIANENNISPFALSASIFYQGIKPSLWATSVLDNNALIDKLFDSVGTKFVNELNK
jgi:hypothetical protein